MSRQLFLILVALILVCGGAFFWWNSRPEQQLGRLTDDLMEAIRFEKLSLKQKESRHTALKKIFAEEVSFSGKDYFPNQELPIEGILSKVDEFHAMITLCEITELNRETTIQNHTATVHLNWLVKAAAGPRFKKKQEWTFTLYFKKDRDWKVVKMTGEPR